LLSLGHCSYAIYTDFCNNGPSLTSASLASLSINVVSPAASRMSSAKDISEGLGGLGSMVMFPASRRTSSTGLTIGSKGKQALRYSSEAVRASAVYTATTCC
jgi:hypothetical protein